MFWKKLIKSSKIKIGWVPLTCKLNHQWIGCLKKEKKNEEKRRWETPTKCKWMIDWIRNQNTSELNQLRNLYDWLSSRSKTSKLNQLQNFRKSVSQHYNSLITPIYKVDTKIDLFKICEKCIIREKIGLRIHIDQ